MSTLAHSFMADFDDDDDDAQLPVVTAAAAAKPAAASATQVKREPGADSDDEEEKLQQPGGEQSNDAAAMSNGSDDDDDDDDDGAAQQSEYDHQQQQQADDDEAAASASSDGLAPTFSNATPIAELSALLHSDKLQTHMAVISHFQFGTPLPADGTAASAAAAAASSPVAASPPPVDKAREYPYILSSNSLSFTIDSHIASLHKYARDLYAPRYGELEQLLASPVDYARVAKLIGNETDMARVTKLVQGVPGIANNVLLTISVTATTTRGKPLGEEELARLAAVCDTILALDNVKSRLHAYISSRMHALAPNVSAMLGTDVAARLVALAGGLKKLSEMPACNLQNLGKKGKNSSGLSRVAQGVHDGLIVTTKVIQDTPAALRQRAMRLLAGKVTLAARLDSFGADDAPLGSEGATTLQSDGSRGQELLAEVTSKIDKWQEAPASKALKALPIPLQKAKPRRGGKRHRKDKERMAVSDMAKQKNRMFFGKEELTDEYTGEGMGMIGQQGTGVLRVAQKDAKLSKRLSQKTQARLKKNGVVGGAKGALAGLGTVTSLASISGTASSIAFTPAQGMQLVKTESAATRALNKANDTYFATNATFMRVKKEAAAAASSAHTAAPGTTAGVKRTLPPVPSFSQATATAASIGSDSSDAKRPKLA